MNKLAIQLYDYQLDAIERMKNGCILCGGVGSGKSITAIAYYYLQNGGAYKSILGGSMVRMKNPKDLYIITTARKRDTFEWESELAPFRMSPHPESNLYSNKIVIDSWNNITKYKDVKDAMFIFDEQRVVGYGAWSKTFIAISKSNEWILLSATPADNWKDFIPVFIANGFYKNKTEFEREHIVWSYKVKFPKVDRYINTGRLIRLRNNILVTMDFDRPTVSHHEDVFVDYDIPTYKNVMKLRWNPYTDAPIETANELCLTLRKIVNTSEDKQVRLLEIAEKHPRMIIFYNFNYELNILRNLYYGDDVIIAEWNGHKHEEIPKADKWIYLVQYTSGCEGWNCIKTDTIVFFSENYSYKVMTQASGRIDRLNTPYNDLYYYHFKTHSGIDLAISRALKNKKDFNEMRFVGGIK